MCPQFVDFNADGWTDIVTATYEGTVFLVAGSADGWRTPVHVTDSEGRPVLLSLFYDTAAHEYRNVDRSPAGQATPNAEDHCVSVLPFDWDGDGDFDLLLGAYEGRLYLQRNDGSDAEPAFRGENELLTAGDGPFAVDGGLTAPRAVDWDGDGRLDLVCGGFEGGVYLFRNVGEAGAPAFAAAETLIEPREQLQFPFPNAGCYADPVDYDGDGDLDLLVGAYAEWLSPEPPTEREKEAYEQLQAEIDRVSAELSEHYQAMQAASDGMTEEEMRAFWQEQWEIRGLAALSEEQSALFEKLEASGLGPRREAGIWLFERR